MNGIDPSGHAKVPNGAAKGGGSKTNTAGKLAQSSKTPASTASGAKQSSAKSLYTAPPSGPIPAPNTQKPAYTGGAAKAAQSAKTANGQSSPAADFLMQTAADPYLALRETTGQWQLAPASVTQRVEAAKAYARRTCDPNAERISGLTRSEAGWNPKNLIMLSAGSSVLNPDMLSAFWEWFSAILAEKGVTWATAGTFAAADGPLPFGDAIALTLLLSDFLADAESQITIEKNGNEDNKDPSDIISKFFGEQSTPANPPPNKDPKKDDENKVKQTSPNQMNQQVKRGQAPRGVTRVDNPDSVYSKPHVHFDDGTSITIDGEIHDAGHGIPQISGEILQWLHRNGWCLNIK